MLSVTDMMFSVIILSITEPVSEPQVSTAKHSLNDKNCYLSCAEKNGPGVNLTWYEGEKIINQTNSTDISSNLTLLLVIKNQDEGSFSCVAASKEAVTVNSTLWCPPHGAEPNRMQWIVGGIVGVIVVVLVLVAVLICLYMRRRAEGERGCLSLRDRTAGTPSEPTGASQGSS